MVDFSKKNQDFNLSNLKEDYASYSALMLAVSKYKALIKKEEVVLIKRIQKSNGNDSAAMAALVMPNIRMVNAIAIKFHSTTLSRNAFILEGVKGLISAIMKFDIKQDVKLATFAAKPIREAMLDADNEKTRLVRVPRNVGGDLLIKYNSKLKELQQLNPDIAITEEMVAETLNLSTKQIERLMAVKNQSKSGDAPVGNDDGSANFWETNSPSSERADKELMQAEKISEIDKIITNTFTRKPEHGAIIKDAYGLGIDNPMHIDDLVDKYKLSRQMIELIKKNGLVALKQRAGRKLKTYLN